MNLSFHTHTHVHTRAHTHTHTNMSNDIDATTNDVTPFAYIYMYIIRKITLVDICRLILYDSLLRVTILNDMYVLFQIIYMNVVNFVKNVVESLNSI